VVVGETHAWAKRRQIELSELHRQRLVQLSDTYVMRRMTDEICRNHRVRPRTIAEINSIDMVLRALGAAKRGRFDAEDLAPRS
jgi:DNA-binding transcriptional LysR family regulator